MMSSGLIAMRCQLMLLEKMVCKTYTRARIDLEHRRVRRGSDCFGS
jgi:hypothetical protein